MTQGASSTTTILVIDDREENRMVLRYLFEPPQWRVLEAADGRTGLELAQREHPDCILLDLSMPGLNGFEVLERLQAERATRDIPVIILTATDDSAAAMDRALRGGAVDYIMKPISPSRVAVRVRAVVERRRLAREIDDLRNAFTSMLVHDLRAPITVIQGYTQLLLAGAAGLSERHQRYVTKIGESCERMLRLIGEILDVSRLEAGRLSLELEPCDVGLLARQIAEAFQPVADEQSITLGVSVDAELPTVMADVRRLEQVLSNLLVNALKFTPFGGRVTITAGKAGDGVQVTVADTGPGIPEDEMSLLFEKFSQTSAGKAAGKAGTGLGLLICRHLVEAHGGRIWAESEVGRGSRFVFRIPNADRQGSGVTTGRPATSP